MEMTLLLLSGVSIVCTPPPLVFIIRVMKVITVVVFLTKLSDTLLTVSNNGYGDLERGVHYLEPCYALQPISESSLQYC